MKCSTVHLLDLPDEMLIEIFNKLPRVDVLYSVWGVNKRPDRLIRDPIFTHFLDLTAKTSFGERCSMSDVMLDRFCSCILPQIHHNIQSLLVKPSSIERILLACDYPNLCKVILNSVKPKVFIKYLSSIKFIDFETQVIQSLSFLYLDDSSIVHIFKQITHLQVFTNENYNTISQMDLNINAYRHLFSVCQRLTHLNINGKYLRSNSWIQKYALPLAMCSSSIIVELNVNVRTIDSCLRLLDGRFNQMKTFIITIDSIETPLLNINNQHNLPNLITLFLASYSPTKQYDNLVVPLLRRMPNMERLGLHLYVENRSKFIDGIDLSNDILIYMPRMIKFTFNIATMNNYVDINYWLKKDDIQERYIINDDHPFIHCCIDYFTNGIGRCRISSSPFI